MSLVERCWMITSKFSVIAILIITGICFGVFVYPYMKKKREAALVSIVYIGIMSVLYLIPQQIGNFSAYMLGVVAAFLVMYVQDRRNIYQKIFLAVTFFSIRWLAVAMAGRMDDFITKALVFGNTKKNICYVPCKYHNRTFLPPLRLYVPFGCFRRTFFVIVLSICPM